MTLQSAQLKLYMEEAKLSDAVYDREDIRAFLFALRDALLACPPRTVSRTAFHSPFSASPAPPARR
jgi:hypothetical protein